MLLLCAACGGGGGGAATPELERGVAVVQYFSSMRFLGRSMFASTSDDWKPSELVSYIFSSMGAAEWPPGESSDERDKEQARAARTPMVPANVRLVPLRPDSRHKQQIVIRADDARRMIIVDGYLDPAQKPVLTQEWEMPRPPAKK
jgi:hypothetical protein